MKKILVFGAAALFLSSIYSCKKCFNCTREKFCYTCAEKSNSSNVIEKCADQSQTQDEFNTYISSISSTYDCTAKIQAAKDETSVCDGGLFTTATGFSLDKVQLESVGWSCAKK